MNFVIFIIKFATYHYINYVEPQKAVSDTHTFGETQSYACGRLKIELQLRWHYSR